MKNSKVLKTILILSGLLGAGIGAAILLTPAAFHGSAGIDLGGDASLLSEVRASGGMLLACGLLIMLGAFISRLTFTATLLSALLYLSYGASRLFSIAVDGMPHETLVMAAALEIVVGLICVVALVKTREH